MSEDVCCEDCNMTFSSQALLDRHKAKFCDNSSFDPAFLKGSASSPTLKNVGMESSADGFQPERLRNMLQRELIEIGQMQAKHSQAHRDVVGHRRAELEGDRLRAHADVEAQRKLYSEKLKALRASKVLEVQLAMAKQQAKQELRGLGRKDLIAAREAKKTVLEKTLQERGQLEQELKSGNDRITSLETKMAEKKDRIEAKYGIAAQPSRTPRALDESVESKKRKDEIAAKIKENATEKGRRIGLIQSELDALQNERKRLDTTINDLGEGYLPPETRSKFEDLALKSDLAFESNKHDANSLQSLRLQGRSSSPQFDNLHGGNDASSQPSKDKRETCAVANMKRDDNHTSSRSSKTKHDASVVGNVKRDASIVLNDDPITSPPSLEEVAALRASYVAGGGGDIGVLRRFMKMEADARLRAGLSSQPVNAHAQLIHSQNAAIPWNSVYAPPMQPPLQLQSARKSQIPVSPAVNDNRMQQRLEEIEYENKKLRDDLHRLIRRREHVPRSYYRSDSNISESSTAPTPREKNRRRHRKRRRDKTKRRETVNITSESENDVDGGPTIHWHFVSGIPDDVRGIALVARFSKQKDDNTNNLTVRNIEMSSNGDVIIGRCPNEALFSLESSSKPLQHEDIFVEVHRVQAKLNSDSILGWTKMKLCEEGQWLRGSWTTVLYVPPTIDEITYSALLDVPVAGNLKIYFSMSELSTAKDTPSELHTKRYLHLGPKEKVRSNSVALESSVKSRASRTKLQSREDTKHSYGSSTDSEAERGPSTIVPSRLMKSPTSPKSVSGIPDDKVVGFTLRILKVVGGVRSKKARARVSVSMPSVPGTAPEDWQTALVGPSSDPTVRDIFEQYVFEEAFVGDTGQVALKVEMERTRDNTVVPSCWTSLSILSGTGQSLNFGTHVLKMFRGTPPDVLPPPRSERVASPDAETNDEDSTNWLSEPIEAAELHVELLPPDAGDRAMPKKEGNRFSAEAWVDVPRTVAPSSIFVPSRGMDIYIDGARFLPYNVTVSKVVGRIFNSQYKKFGPDISTGLALDCDTLNPMYGFHIEIRDILVPPDAILLLKLYTIELHTRTLVVVGYAVLPLFVVIGTFHPPTRTELNDPNLQVALNQGAHQVRIFKGGPNPEESLIFTDFLKKDFVSCASLLIRLVLPELLPDGLPLSTACMPREEWESRGVILPMRPYSESIYYSESCRPTPEEQTIFETLKLREQISVSDVLVLINAERNLKSEKARRHWIRSRLTRIKGENPRALNYSYIVKHAANVGIAVAVESAQNLPRGKLCFPVLSISPPGALYKTSVTVKPQPGGEGLSCTMLGARDLAWDSVSCTRNSPTWAVKSPSIFKGFEMPSNGVLILDLRILDFKSGNATMANDTQGFAILPLSTDDGFVKQGRYQIPLFAGIPPTQVLDRIQIDGPSIILQALAQRALKYVDGASVTVRIGDPRLFVDVASEPLNDIETPPDKKYRIPMKSKPIRTALPKGIDQALIPASAELAFKSLFATSS